MRAALHFLEFCNSLAMCQPLIRWRVGPAVIAGETTRDTVLYSVPEFRINPVNAVCGEGYSPEFSGSPMPLISCPWLRRSTTPIAALNGQGNCLLVRELPSQATISSIPFIGAEPLSMV
jgi:hypothetical protein